MVGTKPTEGRRVASRLLRSAFISAGVRKMLGCDLSRGMDRTIQDQSPHLPELHVRSCHTHRGPASAPATAVVALMLRRCVLLRESSVGLLRRRSRLRPPILMDRLESQPVGTAMCCDLGGPRSIDRSVSMLDSSASGFQRD